MTPTWEIDGSAPRRVGYGWVSVRSKVNPSRREEMVMGDKTPKRPPKPKKPKKPAAG